MDSGAKQQNGTSSQFRFADFEIDCARRELRRRGMKIELKGRPFTVLTILVRSAGQLVTREELRRQLWSSETHLDFDANLSTALRNVRRALDDSHKDSRFIETISGEGYRFLESVFPMESEVPIEVDREFAHSSSAPLNFEEDANLPQQSAGTFRPIRYKSLVIIAVVILVSVFVGYIYMSGRGARSDGIRLLVLPLSLESSDPADDYFASGMTDELTTKLAQLSTSQFTVISETTAMHYRNTGKTVGEVAREVGANCVLEGSVTKSTDRIRVSVRLIRANGQTSLWAQEYDRPLGDAITIQDDITTHVARAIPAKVLALHEFNKQDAGTKPEAYEDYLRGEYFLNRRDRNSLEKALTYFQASIDLEPRFAASYAGIAETYSVMALWTNARPSDTFPKAEEAARKSLDINPSIPIARAVLAEMACEYDRDWEKAIREFEELVETDPGYEGGHEWFARCLSRLGRSKEAVAEIERIRQLDPLSSIVNTQAGQIYYEARQFDQAEQLYLKVLELDPLYVPAHINLWWTYQQLGRFDEATKHFTEGVRSAGAPSRVLEEIDSAYKSQGVRGVRAWMLKKALENPKSYVSPYYVSRLFALNGDREKALEWLAKAVTSSDSNAAAIKVDPALDSLRDDSRFQSYIQEMRFPP
jgi:TolB-like protein/DNA-binding winged helix-turn-helix (wHTH) protein/Flp pilus assembly protein TadD